MIALAPSRQSRMLSLLQNLPFNHTGNSFHCVRDDRHRSRGLGQDIQGRYSTYHLGTKVLPGDFRPQLFEQPRESSQLRPQTRHDLPRPLAHGIQEHKHGGCVVPRSWLLSFRQRLITATSFSSCSDRFVAFCSFPALIHRWASLFVFCLPQLECRATGINACLPVFSHQINSCLPHRL